MGCVVDSMMLCGLYFPYMKKNQLQFYTIYKKEPEGGYTAMVPSLPGCVSYGDTMEDAKSMIADAIKGYLKSVKKQKQRIHSDEEIMAGMIVVSGAQYV